MTITLTEFIHNLFTNVPFLITVLLTLGAILVNGGTDAPNAIATAISTRAIKPRQAIILAAIMNFFGVFVMTVFNAKVAFTISNIVNFGDDSRQAVIALCAALVAIVVWAVGAWQLGIPTSESHALIAGLSGAAIAIMNGAKGINGSEWTKVLWGLLLSTVLGFFMGYVMVKLVEFAFSRVDRSKTPQFFNGAQIFGAAAMAFMHGAQDGQKFMGVFLLGAFLTRGEPIQGNFVIPIWMMILCSVTMGLGTSIGGYRIIKSVGMDMVKLEKHQGFAADLSAATCLLISSIGGIPVSTTHTKMASIMGVGAAKRLSSLNLTIVGEMVMAWVLTFPGCGLIGFLMAKIFMAIF